MVSFPYYSHIFRDSYGNGMGIVWEAYHKQVPLLGVPGITLDFRNPKTPFYVGLLRSPFWLDNRPWGAREITGLDIIHVLPSTCTLAMVDSRGSFEQ